VARHGTGRLTSRRLADWAAHVDPATFVALDLLELDGRVLVDEPYTARRQALEGLGLDGLQWVLTPSDGDGEAVWAATRDLGLEGVVAKDPRSTWVPRRTKRWLKCKHWRHGTFAGVGWAAAADKGPAGLVLGAPGAVGELRVIGVAPHLVDRETRQVVMALIDGLRARAGADARAAVATAGALGRRGPRSGRALPRADANGTVAARVGGCGASTHVAHNGTTKAAG